MFLLFLVGILAAFNYIATMKKLTSWFAILLIATVIKSCGGCNERQLLEKAKPYYEKAVELEQNGQFSSAVAFYDTAIQIFPDYRDAYFQMGTVYERLVIPEKAAASYRAAIRNDADFAAAHNNLGNCYGKLNKLDSALVHLKKAIQLDPQSPSAHYNLGHAALLKGDFSGAETAFTAALALRPSDPDYLQALAMLYVTQNKLAEALPLYERAALQRLAQPELRYRMALVYRDQKMYPSALTELEAYLKTRADPQEQTMIRRLIGEIKVEQSREKLAQARKVYQKP